MGLFVANYVFSESDYPSWGELHRAVRARFAPASTLTPPETGPWATLAADASTDAIDVRRDEADLRIRVQRGPETFPLSDALTGAIEDLGGRNVRHVREVLSVTAASPSIDAIARRLEDWGWGTTKVAYLERFDPPIDTKLGPLLAQAEIAAKVPPVYACIRVHHRVVSVAHDPRSSADIAYDVVKALAEQGCGPMP